MGKPNKISLGCGAREAPAVLGLDQVDYGWNKIWNAGDSIPCDSNSIEVIEAYNFFEHLNWEEIRDTINECWRVLRPEGELDIIVPNVKWPEMAWSDPTHKSAWTIGTFQYLSGVRPRNSDLGLKPFNLKFAKPYPKEERAIWGILVAKK